MGAFIIILPVVAFDVWLLLTTGKRQFKIWADARAWPRLVGLAALGICLGIWLAFYVKYNWSDKMRVVGFPIPAGFFHLENGEWVDFILPPAIQYVGIFVNLLSGFIAPLIPFKVAEFLRAVKAELSHAPH